MSTMQPSPLDASQQRSPLERFLGLFSEVRAGEGATVLLLTLNVFVLMTTYYIIKPVREALILAGGGAELKSYSSAGQALLLLAVVPAYAALASRVPRRRLINTVTLIFTGCLVGFYALAQVDVPLLGVAFFLWVGIFNVMIIAQFWSFANDVYSKPEGERLFPIVGFGMSVGAVAGSFSAGQLIRPFGIYQMLLVSAALLLGALAITNVVETRSRRQPPDPAVPARQAAPEETLGSDGAFALVFRNRYLLLIALAILILNWVNSSGEYILSSLVTRTAASEAAARGLREGQFIGTFYSNFFGVVNVAGVLIQLFLVYRIIKYLGVRVALLILPVIALGAYVLLAFYPVLQIVRWAKTAENSTDYSLQNTLRAVLFLPTTREEKYKAKQAIDTFFVRVGDVLAASVVYVGTTFLSMTTARFALVNVALVAIWIGLVIAIGRRFQAMTAAGPAVESTR